jgi:hypothetical protein
MDVLGLYISFLFNNVEIVSLIEHFVYTYTFQLSKWLHVYFESYIIKGCFYMGGYPAHPSTPNLDAPRGLLVYRSGLHAHELPDLHHPPGESVTPFSSVSHDHDAGSIYISVRSVLMLPMPGSTKWYLPFRVIKQIVVFM